MSDRETGDYEKDEKNGNGLEKFIKTPFFTFAKPYFNLLEQGKLYSLVYIIMAIVNVIIPFAVLALVIKSGVLDYLGGKGVMAFIFSWLVIVFASWVGFQLWWDRKSILKTLENSEFVVTPVLSQILEVYGEWLGTFIGIVGAGAGLFGLIFLGDDARILFSMLPMGEFLGGPLTILVGPVFGFFIILFFRFIAEQLRIFVALANNSKEIAGNIKEKKS